MGLTFPKLLDAFTPLGACEFQFRGMSSAWNCCLLTSPCSLNVVGFYAGINTLALVWIFLFVRETRKLTLEELDRMYRVKSSSIVPHEPKAQFGLQRSLRSPSRTLSGTRPVTGHQGCSVATSCGTGLSPSLPSWLTCTKRVSLPSLDLCKAIPQPNAFYVI